MEDEKKGLKTIIVRGIPEPAYHRLIVLSKKTGLTFAQILTGLLEGRRYDPRPIFTENVRLDFDLTPGEWGAALMGWNKALDIAGWPTKPPEYLSKSDAARELGVTRPTVYRWIEEGKLDTVTIADRQVIPKEDVDDLKPD